MQHKLARLATMPCQAKIDQLHITFMQQHIGQTNMTMYPITSMHELDQFQQLQHQLERLRFIPDHLLLKQQLTDAASLHIPYSLFLIPYSGSLFLSGLLRNLRYKRLMLSGVTSMPRSYAYLTE